MADAGPKFPAGGRAPVLACRLVYDTALLRLAGRQHGLVTTRQLAAVGYTHDAIRRRVEGKVLIRVHRGVYAVAGVKDTF
jgi:hypothetical protein